ncbi:alkaline phosphatase [Luteococcus sp. H138]|uniref:alkaline phosphatase n=1 Tax=unclassified Luteococcus TaxID=2639923 RepID=UPI00313C3778
MQNRRIAASLASLALVASFACAGTNGTAADAAPQPVKKVKKAKAPKNVIVLIGDGMGYNQIAAASLYQKGRSYKQAVGQEGAVREVKGKPVNLQERWPVQVDMATYSVKGSYDPLRAWRDFDYVKADPTDSAAAGTAMSSGVKTYNAGLGVDPDGNPVENISERAIALGKSAGSISSVQFSHATPASYVVHNKSRNDYHGIAKQEVASKMTVMMGAGNPNFDDNGNKLKAPKYGYIAEEDYKALQKGAKGWKLLETKADFQKLTKGKTPKRVFGIPQVATTLQQNRDGESEQPYDVALNKNVPDLATMTKGALNVLDNDPDGFTLMVEGGAIDWAGHGNQGARNIEETLDFNKAVAAVNTWVEKNSSWDETLVIVTADHETGYLSGAVSDPNWTLLRGKKGRLPQHAWHSDNHTNQLVPVYAKGAGSKQLAARAVAGDPVRGKYLDNTDLANVLLKDLWANKSAAMSAKKTLR